MSQIIDITTEDGHHLSAYQAGNPEATSAVVILQEIFGVNHHIRSVVDLYAKEGFLAIAPALFDRVKKGVELAYTPEAVQEGRQIAGQLQRENILKDIAATLAYARNTVSSGKAGIVGYCLGGSYAWLSTTRLSPSPDAAVGYYGSLVAQFIEEKPQSPVLLHFGSNDKGIPLSDVDKIKQGRPELPVYIYEAGHGFNCEDRASFSAEAASLALTRSLSFLREHLGHS